MQKFSMMQESKQPQALQRGYFRQPLWFLGLSGVIFGALFDFAALGFIAQSLATPLGSVTMVANVVCAVLLYSMYRVTAEGCHVASQIFAHLWLKEPLSADDIKATAAIVSGAVLVAAFADKAETCYTMDELLPLYVKPAFIGCMLASALLCKLSFG